MGWFDPQPSSQDLGTFDYNIEAEKLKRQRALAQQLMQKGLTPPQGQMVSGWYVAPGKLEALSHLASAVLGAYSQDNADKAQAGLNKTSLDALTAQLGGLSAGVRDPDQDRVEADAQLQREANRGQGPSEPPADPPPMEGAQAFPVRDADITTTALPLTPPVSSVRPTPKPVAKTAVRALSVEPAAPVVAPESPVDLARRAAFTLNRPGGSVFDKPAPQTRTAQLAAALQAPAPVEQQPKPAAPPQPALLPQPAPAAPMLPPAQPPQPAPQASDPGMGLINGQVVANPFSDQPAPPGMAMLKNGQLAQVSNTDSFDPAHPYDRAPSQQEQVARLIALGRTGPEGQAIAQAQLNQLFASKNGRFSTAVHADPVNGGFVQVTTDSQTGASKVAPINLGGGEKVLETKDTPQGVMERTARGWRPAVDQTGQRFGTTATAADRRAAAGEQVKLGSAVTANQAAQSSIDSSLARLDRIEQLFKETRTGPLIGSLPNFTAKSQELHSLLAQDIFAETRDAVAGAADAGGAPRMAQSEFKYMANNGGLQQTTHAEAASNLIAQQRLRLLALKRSLGQYSQTLDAVAPAAQQTGSAPGRGQSVSASQFGF